MVRTIADIPCCQLLGTVQAKLVFRTNIVGLLPDYVASRRNIASTNDASELAVCVRRKEKPSFNLILVGTTVESLIAARRSS